MPWNRTNQVFVFVLSLVICASADAAQKPESETKKLTVYAAGQVPGAAGLSLLPQPQEMTDGDAFPLYQKAIQSLPKELDWTRIRAWRGMPLKELPQEEIGLLLRQSDAAFQLLEQAGKCRQCEWLLSSGGDSPLDLTACRNSVFLLALQARSQLARGDYESCTRTLGSGLALAKHLSTAPTVIHLLVGVGASAILYGEIEQYMQQPGAPSLEAALRAIPKPLFDEKHSDLYGTDEASRSRAQLILRRGNRHLVVLQYLETLRSYAAGARRWPRTLEDLKTDLPNDPVSEKPFSYRRVSDTQAILEGPLPEGGGAKDNVRYELTLVKKM
jgi:hypothetical protein